jgi:hypothetical protein
MESDEQIAAVAEESDERFSAVAEESDERLDATYERQTVLMYATDYKGVTTKNGVESPRNAESPRKALNRPQRTALNSLQRRQSIELTSSLKYDVSQSETTSAAKRPLLQYFTEQDARARQSRQEYRTTSR